MPAPIRSFLLMCWGGHPARRIVQVDHRRDPPPKRSVLSAQRSEGGGRSLWTHLGDRAREGGDPWGDGPASSDLGTFEVAAVESAWISQQARRRPITWQFCFGAVPYTVQRHDCRGIFAGTAARVHAIGGGMMRAAIAAMINGRRPGCSCARTKTVVPRR